MGAYGSHAYIWQHMAAQRCTRSRVAAYGSSWPFVAALASPWQHVAAHGPASFRLAATPCSRWLSNIGSWWGPLIRTAHVVRTLHSTYTSHVRRRVAASDDKGDDYKSIMAAHGVFRQRAPTQSSIRQHMAACGSIWRHATAVYSSSWQLMTRATTATYCGRLYQLMAARGSSIYSDSRQHRAAYGGARANG